MKITVADNSTRCAIERVGIDLMAQALIAGSVDLSSDDAVAGHLSRDGFGDQAIRAWRMKAVQLAAERAGARHG